MLMLSIDDNSPMGKLGLGVDVEVVEVEGWYASKSLPRRTLWAENSVLYPEGIGQWFRAGTNYVYAFRR